jgi:hypothetical protein
MIRIAHITGNGTSNLYELCAAAYGFSIPGGVQAKEGIWPDPVSYLNVTGTGTLKDLSSAESSDTDALPFTVSDVVNSITLQNLLPSNEAAMVVTINSK